MMATTRPQHTRRHPHHSMLSPVRPTTHTSSVNRSQPSRHLSRNTMALPRSVFPHLDAWHDQSVEQRTRPQSTEANQRTSLSSNIMAAPHRGARPVRWPHNTQDVATSRRGKPNPSNNAHELGQPEPTKNALVEQHQGPTTLSVFTPPQLVPCHVLGPSHYISEVAAHPASTTPPCEGMASTREGLSEVTAHPASAAPPCEGTTSTRAGCDKPTNITRYPVRGVWCHTEVRQNISEVTTRTAFATPP